MKVCYVDESGNQTSDPCLVMVGVVVDAMRLNRTRDEFNDVFEIVQSLFEENLRELKGSKMIFGRDRWRNVDPSIRKRIAEFFCNWVVGRKHHLVLAAVDREQMKLSGGDQYTEIAAHPWLASSLHIALQLQKHHQGQSKNKGHTFLLVDENKKDADRLAELLFTPPSWTDDYYSRGKKQARLDQLIDSAFAVKSHHAGLVQVADLYALMFRRYAELHDYGQAEAWDGERSLIDGYVATLATRLLPRPTRWPARPKSAIAEWFNEMAPSSLKALGA